MRIGAAMAQRGRRKLRWCAASAMAVGVAVCVAGSLWWTAKRWWLAAVAAFFVVPT